MKVEMHMPQMGESIAEATVLKWLKNVGDKVTKDETILEISTDKVDSEIPSPESGILIEIKAAEGETVAVKSIIALIETEESQAQISSSTPSPEPKAEAAAPTPSNGANNTPHPTAASSDQTPRFRSPAPTIVDGVEQTHAPSLGSESAKTSTTSPAAEPSDGRYYSPLVKSLAKQHSVSQTELAAIPGTGTNGRVTKKDFLAYIDSRGSGPTSATPLTVPSSSPSPSAPIPATLPGNSYNEEGIRVEPMSRMRQLIADHMVMSKATSPHVYSVAEVDVTNISLARKKHQKAFMAREGFKLSYTPFFLLAAVKGLVQYPYLNSSVEGHNVILKKDINLGVAVALGTTGLIVPVIKKADQLSLAGMARSLNDLASRARNKQLKPDETQGGTFTVTNPGIFGNIIGCPIINQPQVAILATCAIKKRPVVVDGMIAIRDVIYLTLSYDHRVVDGSLSGLFLKFVTEYLEGWDPNEEIL